MVLSRIHQEECCMRYTNAQMYHLRAFLAGAREVYLTEDWAIAENAAYSNIYSIHIQLIWLTLLPLVHIIQSTTLLRVCLCTPGAERNWTQ